ncbi:MAG: hypothetical protein HZB98_01685, partial [Bacteroidia bacterium]|nr:hypothetical protein [Bacteroidia bacterium]
MKKSENQSDIKISREEIIADYRLANLSRNLSIIGRREVLSGRAKFGIFGDGKEIIQIAMAKQFRNGDWRSGYYRDQTWMMAMKLYNSLQFFHQLYGNTDRKLNPGNSGRNAAGVLQVPMAISVYDDGYGISVPKKYQTTKGSISEILKGFETDGDKKGIRILKGKGWDYAGLIKLYEEGIAICRNEHTPVLFHIEDVTQPQGHSTSGSHERYKSEERLKWEQDFDPIIKMRDWVIASGIATEAELDKVKTEAEEEAKDARKRSWDLFQNPIKIEREALVKIINDRSCRCAEEVKEASVETFTDELKKVINPIRKDNFVTARKMLRNVCGSCQKAGNLKEELQGWLKRNYEDAHKSYDTFLYNETPTSSLKVKPIP